MQIEGKITYQDLEGGFWGIVSVDGNRYVPIEQLPEKFRVDGLAISADVEEVLVLGTSMWGQHVRVVKMVLNGSRE